MKWLDLAAVLSSSGRRESIWEQHSSVLCCEFKLLLGSWGRKKKKTTLRCIMMWVCYCDPPHFCGRPSPRGLTRFCSSFPPVVEWYSGWGMRQKATLVRDSTQEFLLVRMTQDPDICLQRREKKPLTGGNQRGERICSEVDRTCEQMLDSCCENLTQAALCFLDGYTTFTPESCRAELSGSSQNNLKSRIGSGVTSLTIFR